MTDLGSDDNHLRAHPILSRLLDAGANVRALRGYVGPSKDADRLRLYPSLGDLSFSIEIAKSDIVASAAAPETLLPHGGTVVWVRPEAEITSHGSRTIAMGAPGGRRAGGLAAGAGLGQTAAADLVDVKAGRLRIMLRPKVMSTCASCTCSSCETHPSCTSTCNQIAARPTIVVGP